MQVPMRWPAEPEWNRPEALAVLDGSPVNCLVLSSRNETLERAASARGISCVASPDEAGAVTIAEPVWPGVQRSGKGTSTSDSGPTGPPWVDANGWAVSLARWRNPGKQVWVPAEPPGDRILRPEHYALAVADAEAYGGRWIVSLDASVRKGLQAGDGQAKESWGTLVKALRFFESRRTAIATAETAATIGISCDFEGQNEFLGTEVLNLASRRHLAWRILPKGTPKLDGLPGVLWLDTKAPAGESATALRAYVERGGILVVPPSAAHIADGLQAAGKHETGYKLYAFGKGRVAVSADLWSDPWVVVADVGRVIGRRADVFRLWNAGASNAVVLGKTVWVLNFTARPAGHPMSLWLARPAKAARFSDMFGRAEGLEVEAKGGGTEVKLPPFIACACVEFGEKA